MKELSVLQKPADKTSSKEALLRFYKINIYHHKLKGPSQPPLHPLIYSHGFMLALGNSMDDIKAGEEV
jgi:hypothetical protein